MSYGSGKQLVLEPWWWNWSVKCWFTWTSQHGYQPDWILLNSVTMKASTHAFCLLLVCSSREICTQKFVFSLYWDFPDWCKNCMCWIFPYPCTGSCLGFSQVELLKSTSHVASLCNCYIITTHRKLKIWLWYGLQWNIICTKFCENQSNG
jgi:hypothetical protein